MDSATYDQDIRDFCIDCGVTARSVQNVFRQWHTGLKSGSGTAINVAGQVNLLVRPAFYLMVDFAEVLRDFRGVHSGRR